jgi:hypothetical protein
VVINYVNPGLCYSELTRHVNENVRARIETMRVEHGRTTEMGSRTLLHSVVGGPDTHGTYLSECEVKE